MEPQERNAVTDAVGDIISGRDDRHRKESFARLRKLTSTMPEGTIRADSVADAFAMVTSSLKLAETVQLGFRLARDIAATLAGWRR